MKENEIDTPPLEQHLADIISGIIQRKDAEHRYPTYADSVEILNQLHEDAKEALNNMCRSKVLTFHRTLNGTSFEFTPPK